MLQSRPILKEIVWRHQSIMVLINPHPIYTCSF